MGKGQSRILNSFLGGGGSQSSSSRASDRALFRPSSSMDSISTAVSFGTLNHNSVTQSSSLDNLHQAPQGLLSREEAGKRYFQLDNASENVNVNASVEDEQDSGEGEGEGRRQGRQKLTQSLPMRMELHVQRPARKSQSEPDGFSDNFVSHQQQASGGSEEGLAQVEDGRNHSGATARRSSRRPHQEAFAEGLSKRPSDVPEIPDQLLHKLSSEDWECLITTIRDHLEFSLQSSLRGKLGPEHCRREGRDRRVRTAGEAAILPQPDCSCLECARIVCRGPSPDNERESKRRRRGRRERPTSLPPLTLKNSGPDFYDANEGAAEESLNGFADDEGTLPPLVQRSRSRSHDDCYHHKCTVPDSAETTTTRSPYYRKHCDCSGRHRNHCEHTHGHHGRAKKKKLAKSSSKDTPVDVSLDDNCPGLPENRVRRAASRHSHSHAVCNKCLESFGDSIAPRPRPPRAVQQSSPRSADEVEEQQDGFHIQLSNGTKYVTLEELKTVALLLRRTTTGCVEQDDGMDTHAHSHHLRHSDSFGRGGTKKHHGRTRSGKHKTTKNPHFHLKVEEATTTACNGHSTRMPEYQDLIFAPRHRNGRESPATDMAVANLDMNSPAMLEPLCADDTLQRLDQSRIRSLSDSSLNNHLVVDGDSASLRHLHMHSHHHFHHVIHHSQP